MRRVLLMICLLAFVATESGCRPRAWRRKQNWGSGYGACVPPNSGCPTCGESYGPGPLTRADFRAMRQARLEAARQYGPGGHGMHGMRGGMQGNGCCCGCCDPCMSCCESCCGGCDPCMSGCDSCGGCCSTPWMSCDSCDMGCGSCDGGGMMMDGMIMDGSSCCPLNGGCGQPGGCSQGSPPPASAQGPEPHISGPPQLSPTPAPTPPPAPAASAMNQGSTAHRVATYQQLFESNTSMSQPRAINGPILPAGGPTR